MLLSAFWALVVINRSRTYSGHGRRVILLSGCTAQHDTLINVKRCAVSSAEALSASAEALMYANHCLHATTAPAVYTVRDT